MLRDRKKSRKSIFSEREDVNPMEYVSNLSDVMLVLAVGMMLALVVAWNVDLVGIGTKMEEATMEGTVNLEAQTDTITNMLENPDINIADYGLTEYGTVYTDGNGKLYVIGVEDMEDEE